MEKKFLSNYQTE